MKEEHIVQKGMQLYEQIRSQGVLSVARNLPEDDHQPRHSRQFCLDRLVGDNQYIFFSVGKRYWNEPTTTNFGFLFDAERLLGIEQALLRTHDLLADYGDILDETIKAYVPTKGFGEEFSPEEVSKLLAALEDPESDYSSPNDAYYMLLDAVEHQHQDVPYVKEATSEFLKRVQSLQQQYQYSGEEALNQAYKQGETGQYEILVKDSLSLEHCIVLFTKDKNRK